ncbi:lipopolysaccharide biosynthesis protein [Mesonia ostreae]|uniref:Lipopolysaccharide biosynthesis protein n=1 Tax=Mesonia ostreae TaxID=861110 RepID=A0ABU2KH61_9FLAO|nr:lipopolysaccharide biosynthesis protein [Mesonia ostreae]MDT0294046.1 lipopolysaccharide biosynthesis protein [Mesonia ostreae]
MKEFIKSFFSFGLATSIQKMMAFLLLPVYTRYFTTVEFGVIDLIQVILGIASIFAILQLETAMQRYYYELKGKLKKIFISTIFIVIVSFSIFLTLVLFFFSAQISSLIFKTVEYSGLIELASFQLPFTNFSMLAFILLRYEKKNKSFVFLMLAKVLLMLALVLVLVVWLKIGIEGVFYAQLVSLAVSSILIFLAVRDYLALKMSIPLFKKAWKYAMPQIPARVGSVSLSYANRFFMVSFLTVASIGVYSLSLKLASAIQLIYSAFIMAWAPFMFEQLKKPDHKTTFAHTLGLASGPLFLLVSLISLFSKELVVLVASQEFYESHHFVGGLSLYFSLFIIKEIVDIGPKVLEKTKFLSYTFFVSVIINISTLYFLIRSFGLYGVVYSMLITNTVLVALSWFVSNKLYYIPFKIPKFIMLALPAFFLAIYSMYQLPNIWFKILISFVLIGYYGFVFWKDYNIFRTTIAKNRELEVLGTTV